MSQSRSSQTHLTIAYGNKEEQKKIENLNAVERERGKREGKERISQSGGILGKAEYKSIKKY